MLLGYARCWAGHHAKAILVYPHRLTLGVGYQDWSHFAGEGRVANICSRSWLEAGGVARI